MGNATSIIITIPFAPPPTTAAALDELGFKPTVDAYGDPDHTVWLRLGVKWPLNSPSSFTHLQEYVTGLAWPTDRATWHLEVLWRDEHTMDDDSFAGRVTPYGWIHETWPIPPVR